MLIFLTLQIAEADSVAGVGTGWVLDNFPKTLSQVKVFQEDQILPDMLFCLTDSKENDGMEHRNNSWRAIYLLFVGVHVWVVSLCWAVLKRMYEKNKETIDEEIRNRLKAEIAAKIQQSSWVLVRWYSKVGLHLWNGLQTHPFCVYFRSQKKQKSDVRLSDLETVVEEDEGTICLPAYSLLILQRIWWAFINCLNNLKPTSSNMSIMKKRHFH